jgi:hypothetical protein
MARFLKWLNPICVMASRQKISVLAAAQRYGALTEAAKAQFIAQQWCQMSPFQTFLRSDEAKAIACVRGARGGWMKQVSRAWAERRQQQQQQQQEEQRQHLQNKKRQQNKKKYEKKRKKRKNQQQKQQQQQQQQQLAAPVITIAGATCAAPERK